MRVEETGLFGPARRSCRSTIPQDQPPPRLGSARRGCASHSSRKLPKGSLPSILTLNVFCFESGQGNGSATKFQGPLSRPRGNMIVSRLTLSSCSGPYPVQQGLHSGLGSRLWIDQGDTAGWIVSFSLQPPPPPPRLKLDGTSNLVFASLEASALRAGHGEISASDSGRDRFAGMGLKRLGFGAASSLTHPRRAGRMPLALVLRQNNQVVDPRDPKGSSGAKLCSATSPFPARLSQAPSPTSFRIRCNSSSADRQRSGGFGTRR